MHVTTKRPGFGRNKINHIVEQFSKMKCYMIQHYTSQSETQKITCKLDVLKNSLLFLPLNSLYLIPYHLMI